MRNIHNRLKKLEKHLAPNELSSYKYYRLDNGKYIIIPPDKEGIRVVMDFLFTGDYTESPLTLEQILEEYPNIIDDTERIKEIDKNLDNIFN